MILSSLSVWAWSSWPPRTARSSSCPVSWRAASPAISRARGREAGLPAQPAATAITKLRHGPPGATPEWAHARHATERPVSLSQWSTSPIHDTTGAVRPSWCEATWSSPHLWPVPWSDGKFVSSPSMFSLGA